MKKGNISSSSSSISANPNYRKHVICKHDLPATLRTVKNGIDAGKRFYGCPLWPKGCGLFVFEDDLVDDNGLQMDFVEMKRNLQEKIDKLKLKNAKLKEEIMASRIEIRKHCKGEKITSTLLLISWIFFAIFLMIRNV